MDIFELCTHHVHFHSGLIASERERGCQGMGVGFIQLWNSRALKRDPKFKRRVSSNSFNDIYLTCIIKK